MTSMPIEPNTPTRRRLSLSSPQEGTIQVPYVMCMVKNAPHRENGQAVIDFVLSEKGQQFWAENYLRPVLGELPASAKEKFLPDSEYKRAIRH